MKQWEKNIALNIYLNESSVFALAIIGIDNIGQNKNKVKPDNGFLFIFIAPTRDPIIPHIHIEAINTRVEEATRKLFEIDNNAIAISSNFGIYTWA